ncbi:efflux RND transporter permease subunit [Roseibium sp. SCP14]|uniref:efflux RND transporter permease subunit n=1 Tax=Roseibium sp. SCP14 TaxID=3141375 RepID=UPI0033393F07
MSGKKSDDGGWIAWFVRNPVAANLLMIFILLLGGMSFLSIRTEGFPSQPPRSVSISVSYDSGSAFETERGVTAKVERALKGLEGVKEVTSTSSSSLSSISIEMTSGYDLDKLLTDVKNRVDGVTLPADAETPVVTRELEIEEIAFLNIYGDVDHDVLKRVARRIRDRILADPAIPSVTILGELTPEVTIEIDQETLRRFQVSFADVVNVIAASSVTEEQGLLKSENGRIVVKADAQGTSLRDFENIELISGRDGQRVRLGEIATVRDGFTDDRQVYRFNGAPAIRLTMEMIGKADLVHAAGRVRDVVDEIRAETWLPEEIKLSLWNDKSVFINDRLSLMAKNGLMGMALVLLVLALFLDIRTAFWVSLGLPISFAGALILMGDSIWGLTLNEITTFGFIIALGIVVDDAIIVAESVHAEKEKHGASAQSVIRGVKKVAVPAVFGVLTTIAAFFPITLVPGRLAEIFSLFAWVVIFSLLFSIIESKFILPAHLAHARERSSSRNVLARGVRGLHKAIGDGLKFVTQRFYRPALRVVLRLRYLALIVAAGCFAASLWTVQTGMVRTVFFPDIPSELLTIRYVAKSDLGYGTIFAEALRIEEAGWRVNDELAMDEATSVPPIASIETNASESGDVTIVVALRPEVKDVLPLRRIADLWRKELGGVEGVQSLEFTTDDFDDPEFGVDLVLDDPDLLIAASRKARERVAELTGVLSATNSFQAARSRVRVELNDQGKALGLATSTVATQLASALNGAEVQRFQRSDEEVKVRVRLPFEDRRTLADLEAMYIRLADGNLVPLSDVARLRTDFTVDEVKRFDSNRVASLTADVDNSIATGDDLKVIFDEEIFPELKRDFPSLTIRYTGDLERQEEAMGGLVQAFIITLVAIYGLLAIPLKSYSQPFVVMAAIPFGIVGAILGHLINDLPISILSINGILALCGVVVNDSLLLVSTANTNRANGMDRIESLLNAGCTRMRAVLLTSATTFCGLAPLITETSEQAQFLIPAAVSLGYGILFATVITLVLIPTFLLIRDDIFRLASYLFAPRRQEAL